MNVCSFFECNKRGEIRSARCKPIFVCRVSLLVYLSVCSFICKPIFLFVHLSIFICLFVHLTIHLFGVNSSLLFFCCLSLFLSIIAFHSLCLQFTVYFRPFQFTLNSSFSSIIFKSFRLPLFFLLFSLVYYTFTFFGLLLWSWYIKTSFLFILFLFYFFFICPFSMYKFSFSFSFKLSLETIYSVSSSKSSFAFRC